MTTKQKTEAIHNEFNTASDKVLQQAKDILSGVNIEKSKRLAHVGFKNAKEADVLNKIDDSLSRLINYYSIHYPNNKFIIKGMVQAICKKYKLVCAPIERYTGFVPEKNLTEIEKFHVNDIDKAPDEMIITSAWNTGATHDFLIRRRGANRIHKIIGLNEIPMNHPSIHMVRGEPFSFTGGGWIEKYIKIDNQSVMICAPKKDMDLKGLSKFASVFTSMVEVTTPDPVVLQPVKGGYLIVTAWGDEASDEIVVNEKMN